MTGAGSAPQSQRFLVVALLLVAGVLSLPVVATFLDGESTDQLVAPVQLVLMALLGALVGYASPQLGGSAGSRARGVGAGVLVGVLAALIGDVVFFLLLGGP